MAIATPEAETQTEAGEQHFILYGVDWDQYVRINDTFPDRAGLRMIYIDGSLTFLTLSRRHDWFEDYVDKIVMAVAIQRGIEYAVAGSATFRAEGQKVGVEGDLTYYFGPHAELMAGPIDIDLTSQPPPDLAIEVEVHHPADKAVATYARLGVPEVWRFNVRRRTVVFLILGEDGAYHPTARSRGLPPLGPEDVLDQLRLAEEIGSLPRWFAQLNEWVRTTIVPRMTEG